MNDRNYLEFKYLSGSKLFDDDFFSGAELDSHDLGMKEPPLYLIGVKNKLSEPKSFTICQIWPVHTLMTYVLFTAIGDWDISKQCFGSLSAKTIVGTIKRTIHSFFMSQAYPIFAGNSIGQEAQSAV